MAGSRSSFVVAVGGVRRAARARRVRARGLLPTRADTWYDAEASVVQLVLGLVALVVGSAPSRCARRWCCATCAAARSIRTPPAAFMRTRRIALRALVAVPGDRGLRQRARVGCGEADRRRAVPGRGGRAAGVARRRAAGSSRDPRAETRPFRSANAAGALARDLTARSASGTRSCSATERVAIPPEGRQSATSGSRPPAR